MSREFNALTSLREICQAFGQGEKTVKAWAAAGAPIRVWGTGNRRRYMTEEKKLWDWILQQSKTHN